MPGGLTRLRSASARQALVRFASAGQVLAPLVVLAAVAPYLPTLGNYFAQDDFGVVWLLSRKAWSTFPHWFVSTWMDNIWGYTPDEIRPFPALSYQVAAAFGAATPWPNHVINIALHAVNALLVFWLATTAAGLRRGAAAVAGAVFALLPIQAESVAWITGRVDSMPAAFYFASFALYASWRQGARTALYWWSVACCFVALFCKQNAITLAPALVLYDLIVPAGPTGLRPSSVGGQARRSLLGALARWLGPYVPYGLLTAGYLLLRYVLFGQVAREETLTAQRFNDFASDSVLHVKRLVFGDMGMTRAGAGAAFAVVAVLAGIWLVASRQRGRSLRPLTRTAIYFGGAWTVLGMAPILVAGYYSPRHMYLASLGWAVVVATACQLLWEMRPTRVWRAAAAVVTVAVLGAYAFQLGTVVREWGVRSAVSRRAVTDLEQEALAAPRGALIIVGAPQRSWAFAVPHALRPPFTSQDISRRTRVISHSSLHCCSAILWDDYTRTALRSWIADAARPPVVALSWNPETGARSRIAEADEPYLRPLMSVLLATPDRASLDGAIARMLAALVAPRTEDATPAGGRR